MFENRYLDFLLEKKKYYEDERNKIKDKLAIMASKNISFDDLLEIRELDFKREIQNKEIDTINRLIEEHKEVNKTKDDVYSYIDFYLYHPGIAGNDKFIKSNLKDIENKRGFFNTTIYTQICDEYHMLFIKELLKFVNSMDI